MNMYVSTPSLDAGVDSLALVRAQHPQFVAALDHGASLLTALRHCGIAFWQDGRLDEAAQMLSAAAAEAPNNPAILADLGCLLRLQGKTAEAMQCFLDSLALNPRQVQVWLNAVSLNNETGDRAGLRDGANLRLSCADALSAWRFFRGQRRLRAGGASLSGRCRLRPAICACAFDRDRD